MPEDEKDSAEEKASPEFPLVKITLKDEAGKPVVGAGVLMRLATIRAQLFDLSGKPTSGLTNLCELAESNDAAK